MLDDQGAREQGRSERYCNDYHDLFLSREQMRHGCCPPGSLCELISVYLMFVMHVAETMHASEICFLVSDLKIGQYKPTETWTRSEATEEGVTCLHCPCVINKQRAVFPGEFPASDD